MAELNLGKSHQACNIYVYLDVHIDVHIYVVVVGAIAVAAAVVAVSTIETSYSCVYSPRSGHYQARRKALVAWILEYGWSIAIINIGSHRPLKTHEPHMPRLTTRQVELTISEGSFG